MNEQHDDAIATLRATRNNSTLLFNGRYFDVARVLDEEAALVERDQRAKQSESTVAGPYSFRVTLSWETDANDVDLCVTSPSKACVLTCHCVGGGL